MLLTADNALKQISQAVEDAKTKFEHQNFQVLSWPQTWGNTGCGFGGIVCHAFTTAQTVIVSGESDVVLVYHRGRFAYEVVAPTDEFWVACGQRTLPGAFEWEKAKGKYDSSEEDD